MTAPQSFRSGCTLVWDGARLGEVRDGALVTLRFCVAPGAPLGSYPIGLTCAAGDSVDDDLRPITWNLSGGCICVAANR